MIYLNSTEEVHCRVCSLHVTLLDEHYLFVKQTISASAKKNGTAHSTKTKSQSTKTSRRESDHNNAMKPQSTTAGNFFKVYLQYIQEDACIVSHFLQYKFKIQMEIRHLDILKLLSS